MKKLGELYTDFSRIDLDAPGGYARVADVVALQEDGTTAHRAFKLMRHDLLELLDEKKVGFQRFENELRILVEISRDKFMPYAITRVYDSGFVETEFSKALDQLQHKDEKLSLVPNPEIVSTGIDIQKFLDTHSALMEQEPDHWLPYLVVDLAPYDDSLLRQIKAQSAGKIPNLYALPVNTVVEMSLQLLDVMDYLHKRLGVAYIDWKPEHIYWNEELKQLKLIDWNVITLLEGDPEEKQQIVREDIRMFSGAALYCSLALSDPEELTKPIGPLPNVPKEKAPVILPRYWTDKPNFYQREGILDEKIKHLVQKALDPNQGFNSSRELKNALFQYVGKSYKLTEKDLVTGMPFDAVQYFRRARSYIAARDYVYAYNWLELAVETARKAGVSYSDAEQLLSNVQNILEVNEVKQKVKPLLEKKEQWKEVLDIYTNAISRHPANTLLRKEFDRLQGLLKAESKLRNRRFLRLFTNLFHLRVVLDSTKNIVKPNNPLYSYVEQQYNQIRLAQLGSVFMLLVVVLFASVSTGKLKFFPVPTPAPVILPHATAFNPSITPTQTVNPTSTLAYTPSISPTNIVEPTPTLVVLFYGKLESYHFEPYDVPNENILDLTVERNQLLMILDQRESSGALWYECVWEIEGATPSTGRGWILADRIKKIPPPTPTPVLPDITDMTYGELIPEIYRPVDDSNQTIQGVVLEKNQSLKILSAKYYNGALWYKCEWEVNGVKDEGWILADKIKIVQAPTPTVTP
jgi:serine/threonine protein kinase